MKTHKLPTKKEKDAARKVLKALAPLTRDTKLRIINYFWERFVVHEDNQPR